MLYRETRRGQNNSINKVAVNTSAVTEAKGIASFRIFAASKVESYNVNPSTLLWNSLHSYNFFLFTISKSVLAPKGALYDMMRIFQILELDF